MKIYFLDSGTEKYGDSILIEHASRTIFIDGAHAGNIRQQGSTPSLSDQIATILGPGVFEPDLLIITHLHGDHVGCLPKMVRNGSLKPKKVLAADERWGAGISDDTDADPLAGVDANLRLIAEAMQEEGADFEDEEEARAFIDAFESVEAQYGELLNAFDQNLVLRFGRDDVSSLEQEFRNFGLKFLGPNAEHLNACAVLIGNEKAKAAKAAKKRESGDSNTDRGALLWAAVQARRQENVDNGLADQQGTGSGRNNQSIVLSVGTGTKKVLLAGDMQFAKPEVPGLRDSMKALLGDVAAHGPYRVVKLTHHTSSNGLAETELDALGGDPILIHTGGLFDPKHPEAKMLTMLSARLSGKKFARTDRNGVIAVNLSAAQPQFTLQRGDWNDFTVNSKPVARPRAIHRRDEEPPTSEAKVTVEPMAEEFIEVTARIPHRTTRVTITVDVEPNAQSRGADPLEKKKP